MDHVDLINQIIEAEQRAQHMSEEALKKRETMQEELEESTVNLRETYMQRANARLEKIREREGMLAAEQIAELDALFDKDMRRIEEAFEAHREEWADKLFSMIVSEQG